MKLSGFYMGNGKNKDEASANVLAMFEKELQPHLCNLYKRATMKIIDVYENNFEEKEGIGYDVHFILDLPDCSFEEDSVQFAALEIFVCTGLRVMDEEEENE